MVIDQDQESGHYAIIPISSGIRTKQSYSLIHSEWRIIIFFWEKKHNALRTLLFRIAQF